MQRVRWETALTDEWIVRATMWPLGLSAGEIRERIAAAERYVDYDGTLADWDPERPRLRDPFCGRSLREFLAERPYLVHTQGAHEFRVWTFVPELRHEMDPDLAASYAGLVPEEPLPRPLLVIVPPSAFQPRAPDEEPHSEDGPDGRRQYKDLYAIGVRRGEVYDDLGERVYAPGCTIISTF